jgi:hypothetical protein
MSFKGQQRHISTKCATRIKELLTILKQHSSPPIISGARVAQSLVFCVAFYRLLFALFYFGHYIVCRWHFINYCLYFFTLAIVLPVLGIL